MNELFLARPQRFTTRAAVGLPRWRWTVAEIEKMAAVGFFHEDERIELLGGEIVPMSPKMTPVHRQPSGNTYGFTDEVRPDVPLIASLAPSLTVSLNVFDVD